MAKKPIDITSYGRLPNGDKVVRGRFLNRRDQAKQD